MTQSYVMKPFDKSKKNKAIDTSELYKKVFIRKQN